MAIYLCSVKGISRSKGQSCIAVAAYRAGEKLYSEYTGEVSDYTRKNHVVYNEIMLPEHAPPEWKDRQTFWNSVELSEKRPDAKLATEVMVAIPLEVPEADRVNLIRQFCQKFLADGMVVDFAIHNPPMHDDLGRPVDMDGNPISDPEKYIYNNPHAHIMLGNKPVDENGRFLPRSIGVYKCKNIKTGEYKNFTQAELKEAGEAWQKQYRFLKEDGSIIWTTRAEAEKEHYDPLGNAPLKRRYGIAAKAAAYWTSPQFVRDVRKFWEVCCNDALMAVGSNERVDCRSYKNQGMDKIPQMHLGPIAAQIERRARRMKAEGRPAAAIIHSRIGDINREIQKHNHMIDVYEKQEQEVLSSADMVERKAQELALLKRRWISAKCHTQQLRGNMAELDKACSELGDKLKEYDVAAEELNAAISRFRDELTDLKKELEVCPIIRVREYDAIRKKVMNKQQELEKVMNMLQALKEAYGYDNADLLKADRKALKRAEDSLLQIENKYKQAKEAEVRCKTAYMQVRKAVPAKIRKKIIIQEPKYYQSFSDDSLIGAIGDMVIATQQAVEREIEEEQTDQRYY